MKKVLFVATVASHIKSFHLPYLKLMKDNGYEVHVAAHWNLDENYIFDNCDHFYELPIERSPIKFGNLKAIYKLKKIVEKERYNIIHCHTPMGSVVARFASKKARKKFNTRVIYTAHGFHFYKGAPVKNWLIFYPVEWYLAKFTDTLITINREDEQIANKKFSKRCHDIQYIPGVGIDLNKFDFEFSDEKKEKLKKSLGLKKDDYVLICVARLDKNKNQKFLIECMNEILKVNNNIHLLLVGRDELSNLYQNIVNEMNISSNIHFLGYRSDVPLLLKISDVVVSASKREGLPVNVIEALASGVPAVVLECRGMDDLIDNNKNGIIVKQDDMINFNNSIIKLINDNEFYNKIKKNGKKSSVCYGVESSLEKISKIYYK